SRLDSVPHLRSHVYSCLIFLFPLFLAMSSPPPISTLFPYTTLFRSQSALAPQQANGEFAVVTSTVQLLLHPFRVKRVRLAAPSSLVIQAFVKLPPVQLPAT